MTLTEFSNISKGTIEAKSGYSGKILCKKFDCKKHVELGEREVTAIWAEIRTSTPSGYSHYAQPQICVYVDGTIECEKYFNEKRKKEDEADTTT